MAFRDGALYGWVQVDDAKTKPIKESSLSLQRRADILGSFKLGHCNNKNESFIFNVLTVPLLSRSSEASQPLRFQADTKVKQVIKKIRDETGVASRENETDYLLMIPRESEQGGEASPRVTHAHSHNNVIVMDDVLLESDFPLWMYDVSPVQTLHWKEVTVESIQKEREKQPIWVKIILPDSTCRVMKFDYNTKVSNVLAICKERIKALESLEMRYYGLYWFTKTSGTFLDDEKRLSDCHIGIMDILQIRKAHIFEAAFLSNTDDHPQTLVLNQSTKISQIIKLITGYVAKGLTDECERYGLVHIPSSGITTSTLHWLELNKSLAELNIHLYDILEFKERKGINPTLMSTIDMTAPSVKLIFTQTPDDSSPSQPSNETNNVDNKRDSGGQSTVHSSGHLASHHPPTQQTNVPANFTIEEGEKIITQASDVTYHNQNLNHKAWHGTLFVTTYKLVFQSKQPLDPYLREFFSIPLGTITKIEKLGYKEAYPQLYGLFIGCKDLRNIVFEFQPANGSRKTIYKALSIVLFRGCKHVFAFEHTYLPKSKMQVDTSLLDSYTFPANGDGWKLFDMGKEFKRLFLQRPDPEMQYKWRLSDANQNYQLCPTYPSQLIVPYQLSDEALFGVAQFRSKGRFPILSYLHLNQAALLRCAQPLVGLKRMRSQDDENFLAIIRDLNPNRQLTIIDARPMKNAIANFARGGGYELVDFYPNSEVEFANIENIHAMRAALGRLQNLVSKPVSEVNQTWFTELEATKWLDHIRAIMEATYKTVFYVDRGRSVLVHCSDGWDRTAQIDGLAQICLDPFFRTIVGFEILIEKEWMAYGHMFQTRIGHGEGESGAEARSPIFLQFIDCVFQLTRQFPTYFQWNEKFLISLLDHLYSCKYGTFLFNSEKERLENRVKERTTSYWTFIHDNIRDFTNPFFMHSLSVISPSYNTEDMVFWKGYYARWHRYVHKQHSVDQRGMAFIESISQMTTRLKNLEAEVEALKQENQALKQTDSNAPTTNTNARS